MVAFAVTDWDDAYENGRNIPGGTGYPDAWIAPSAAFRETARARFDIPYGEGARHRYDLFLPEGTPRGLFVFVHGGYWVALDKSYWSHLAAGPLALGWAVAMPSYDLCPDVSIAEITAQTGAAIAQAAREIAGPVVLSGHSAGGHLVTAMMCEDTPLPGDVRARLAHVLSISGLHDLRPLLRTARNDALRLDMESAEANSPALKRPLPGVRLTTWVGGGERQEFLRQSALLANIWHGLGCLTGSVIAPDRHHFNVIDTLAEPDGPMLRSLLATPEPA
ncbi:alpha/beta hydrolase [Sagittula salina]|uniref:Alpha/beta hydrolase n=1 Tax=Sagittula salina TaxID=2820268 RepID=A0A940MM69_9RHOB|nr:alpha/beta hydrolase [Sagittula salina]MBP0482113.1 alpha/beta hydrolase [Sagittula salina]